MNQVPGCYQQEVEAPPALAKTVSQKEIDTLPQEQEGCFGGNATISARGLRHSLECPAGYRLGCSILHVVAFGI